MTTTLSQSIQPQVRTIEGLSIRYAESEPRDDHALLLSPWPESIYCYEPTWTRLAEHTHLVAMDLPGFGQSERRDSLMSPKAMGEFSFEPPMHSAWSNRTLWDPTSAPERRSSPRRCIRAGSGASSSAPAARRFRSSSAAR